MLLSSWYLHVAILLYWCSRNAVVRCARWSHSAYLSPAYRVLWSLGPGPADVTFEVQVRTQGWVGFGFSRDGKMAGADMVIGWVDHGQVYFQDRHVKSSFGSAVDKEPEVDPSQDYQLLLGYENSTHTVLRFRRKLDTCDHHDIPITNDTMRVLWAHHSREPTGGAVTPGSLPPHDPSDRGARPLFLLQRADALQPPPEQRIKVWEVTNDEVKPGAPGEGVHWCRIVRGPQGLKGGKHHLVRYEPLQSPQQLSASGLQHIVLYECQGVQDSPHLIELAASGGRYCHQPHSQPVQCNTVVASWARGSEGFSFPPETGYPMDEQTSRYFLLETHYTASAEGMDSPNPAPGAGLRLYYTPELRRHDSGVISIGMDPNWRHIIPPGQPRVVSSGHCVVGCTSRAFPSQGINVFAVVMKTHKIGRQVTLRHIRNHLELPPIASDENLDPEYQEYRKIDQPVRILPGDHLITQCTYNSSSRSAITLGGPSSREETCLVLGLYYPRQTMLAACHSLPSLPTVLHSLGIQELSPGSNPVRIAAPPELAGMTLESRLVSYDWDNQFHSFQEATLKGSFKPLCWTSQATLLPNTDIDGHFPNITKPYVPAHTDQCSYRRYSTEGGWHPANGLGSPPPVVELDGNHIEGAARSKVSRSSVSSEESLGLSRFNAAPARRFNITNITLAQLSVFLLCWFNR